MTRLAGLLLLTVVLACAGPSSSPPPTAPFSLAGQRVLVLPVQNAHEPDGGSDSLLAALQRYEPRAIWIGPADLQRALRRLPAFAADPAALPHDPLVHHGDRRAGEPLASELRRFSALADARWVLLPRKAQFVNASPRISAALLDARTGVVLWAGHAEEPSTLAARLLGPPQ